ncbi:MAG: ATP-grasp enzyme, D-alanine-D-alanine ligase [Gemmatimonadetes bacterium]|nr:ATP-grasp enzyme, D-alanine-D-alanine ligase [Gemmatimonadota bacterium]
MKPLRVLALMHPTLVPPDSIEGVPEKEVNVWKTEYDVVSTLRRLGHDVRPLGVQYELNPIRLAVEEWQPHVVFNLLEEFHGETTYDQNVASYLELLRVAYTGCNPRGMVIARGKALSKKLLAYHRIRVPAFGVFPRGRQVRRPAHLKFPLIVKSLIEHSSVGIARASVVDSDEKLAERVTFVHQRIGTDAIAEQYIDGRELYVGVLGNDRLKVLPTWELVFGNVPPNAPLIATERVKHDLVYQDRWGIEQGPAQELPPLVAKRIAGITRRIFRTLELDGYARIDYRLSSDGELYFLEANPNPEIAEREEFAQAARHIGIGYPELLERILRLARQRAAGTAVD